MVSFPTSEPNRVARGELTLLRRIVRGDRHAAGLATVLPLLQSAHRRELRTEPHWSKEELVRHPEPRELIRSMRKAGNLDQQGRPMYTLDERRSLTADIYENRVVRRTVEAVEERLRALLDDDSQQRWPRRPRRCCSRSRAGDGAHPSWTTSASWGVPACRVQR